MDNNRSFKNVFIPMAIVFSALIALDILANSFIYISHDISHVHMKPPHAIMKPTSMKLGQFVPLNNEHYVTYQNICFEGREPATRRFVVYGNQGMEHQPPVWFPVTWSNVSMPTTYEFIQSRPAYFLGMSLYSNLYHLLENNLVPLHEMLNKTNRLGEQWKNDLYIRRMSRTLSKGVFTVKTAGYKGENWTATSFQAQFMESLFIKPPLQSIFAPGALHRCYAYAVFQRNCSQDFMTWLHTGQQHRRQILHDYLIKAFNISQQTCQYVENTTYTPEGADIHLPWPSVDRPARQRSLRVTVLQRKSDVRHILNVDQFVTSLRHHGYDAEVVTFEGKQVREQMLSVHCSDIFAGVHGAGLTLAWFLRKTAALVEIAWPQIGWAHYFCNRYQTEPFETMPYSEEPVNLLLSEVEHIPLKWFNTSRKNFNTEQLLKTLIREPYYVHRLNVNVNVTRLMGYIKNATDHMIAAAWNTSLQVTQNNYR